MTSLKPCPFCGWVENAISGSKPIPGLRVTDADDCPRGECDNCLANGPIAETLGMAADAWNRRPLEDAVRKACEEMRAKIEYEWDVAGYEDVLKWADALERATEGK